MKQLFNFKIALIALLGFAVTHFSFTVKTGATIGMVYAASQANAQPSFFPTVDCHNGSYELNKWMSPTNTCGNRFVAMRFSNDTMSMTQNKIYLDSIATHPGAFSTSNMYMSLRPDGLIVPTNFSNVAIPYSQITGAPGGQSITLTAGNDDISITGTYPNFTITPYIPTTYTVNRAINGSTFQISATRQAFVDYDVNVDNTSTLASNQTMSITLAYSTNGGATWINQDISKNSMSQLLGLTVTLVSGGTLKVTGYIPKAAIVRITNSGTGTPTYVFGKETY